MHDKTLLHIPPAGEMASQCLSRDWTKRYENEQNNFSVLTVKGLCKQSFSNWASSGKHFPIVLGFESSQGTTEQKPSGTTRGGISAVVEVYSFSQIMSHKVGPERGQVLLHPVHFPYEWQLSTRLSLKLANQNYVPPDIQHHIGALFQVQESQGAPARNLGFSIPSPSA